MGATSGAALVAAMNLGGPLRWDAGDAPVPDDVVVLPVVVVADAPSFTDATWIGAGLTPMHATMRHRRLQDVGQMPAALAAALPVSLARTLDDDAPTFTAGAWPAGTRRRVEAAVDAPRELPEALAEVGRKAGVTVLVTWVRRVDAVPLTALSHPGDILEFELGPVVVDGAGEPYRVDFTVGAALVGPDGVVALRVEDTWQTVLDASGPNPAARVAADGLATDVGWLWPRGD